MTGPRYLSTDPAGVAAIPAVTSSTPPEPPPPPSGAGRGQAADPGYRVTPADVTIRVDPLPAGRGRVIAEVTGIPRSEIPNTYAWRAAFPAGQSLTMAEILTHLNTPLHQRKEPTAC